jgi:hypothetical protein
VASQTVSVWLLLAVALGAANLPFLTQRLFLLVPLKRTKNLALRLAELVLLYFLAGAFGLFLEWRTGQLAPQGWEFYAVTVALFITFAFPGFAYRYLLRHYH